MAAFRPTHQITLDNGTTCEVMLTADGAAYQATEWDATDAADFERTDDGQWLFQGQPFAGRVEECVVTPDVDSIARRAVQLGAFERSIHGHACYAACQEAGVPAEDISGIASIVSTLVTNWSISGMPKAEEPAA